MLAIDRTIPMFIAAKSRFLTGIIQAKEAVLTIDRTTPMFIAVKSSCVTAIISGNRFKASQEVDDSAWMQFFHTVWAEGLRLQK